MKNEIACQMEDKDNRLEAAESAAKLLAAVNSQQNVEQVLDDGWSEEEGLTSDTATEIIKEDSTDLTNANVGFNLDEEGEFDPWDY